MTCFIDANIFMYSVGAEHPFRAPSRELLAKVYEGGLEAATNAEVLQEILHRYLAIGRAALGYGLVDAILDTFEAFWPVTREDVRLARTLVEKRRLQVRDAIHVATMIRNGVSVIYSFDADFDGIPKIKRKTPGGWN